MALGHKRGFSGNLTGCGQTFLDNEVVVERLCSVVQGLGVQTRDAFVSEQQRCSRLEERKAKADASWLVLQVATLGEKTGLQTRSCESGVNSEFRSKVRFTTKSSSWAMIVVQMP